MVMNLRSIRIVCVFAACQMLCPCLALGEEARSAAVPENLYRGALVSYPGAWNFEIPRSSIILVSDEQLDALTDPDRKVNISLSATPQEESLRQICERGQGRRAANAYPGVRSVLRPVSAWAGEQAA